jgi:tetratricopeptide (TPR) repeat protein
MNDSKDPNHSRRERAATLLREGDLAGAQALCHALLEADPCDSRAQFMLGMVHARQGDLQQAEQHLRNAVGIDPVLAEAWLGLGQLSELKRQYAAAEKELLRALSLRPALADARESLGRVYAVLGRLDDAATQFHLVLDHEPERLSALIGYIGALHVSGRIVAAHEMCARALALAPEHPGLLVRMGQICREMGRLEEARRYYRAALSVAPGFDLAIMCEAEALERTGELEQAWSLLQPLLPQMERDANLLALYARICMRLGLDESIIDRLERALGSPTFSYRGRERIEYMAGDWYDRHGHYDIAFRHYKAANASVLQRLGEAPFVDPIDGIVACFSDRDFGSLPRAAVADATPIFIVGMPRSGTSLVEQIIATHPQVYGAGELNHIALVAAEMEYGTPGFAPTEAGVQAAARRYLDAVSERSGGATVFTDKMPQNFFYLGLIALLLPGARIVHVRREPMDNCLSCYFQDFSAAHPYCFDLLQLGRYYRRYEFLMQYWRTLGISWLEVGYEALVDDLEGVSRRMIEFCGLDWNDACLRFFENKRIANTASYDQVNKPIYRSSVGRWRNYEKHLDLLKEGLGIAMASPEA